MATSKLRNVSFNYSGPLGNPVFRMYERRRERMQEDVPPDGARAVKALDQINLTIPNGQTFVIVGPSGCGKSTLLRVVSGIENNYSGQILYDGVDMRHVPVRERAIGMVFQGYALYPNFSSEGNLSFFFKIHQTPDEEMRKRIEYTSELMGIGFKELLPRRPHTRSGGEKQRVADARAIVRALSVTLILILKGFLTGMNRQITSYLDRSPGSIVIAEEDVVNLLGATSLLPDGIDQKAELVRGVNKVIPILSQFIILDLHGKKQPAYMIGYEIDQGGGPWKLFQGREPQSKWEMVIDGVLANRHGLQTGDQVEVMGKEFTIVGLSSGTASWMTSFFFVRKQDAETLILAPSATSFLLVVTTDRANADEGRIRLSRLSGVNVLTKNEMATNDLKLFAKVFSAPLRLMATISFLVGIMIVGLIIKDRRPRLTRVKAGQ